uniref:Cytochrome c7-like domain-containing protein n=1 Tax=Candidatus Kentrum sp. FM TaxID=2126340 RepID=A0A450TYZ4_9GAMM|nr:MAG: hypothetical protein BECKFM1743A_GA0114220_108072 [Candidatus Kentron sp. FM]VFJ75196.1 MAG: hypothetical protein BECKFM1743C_GA0114222_108282 [Candidatus Kentron sp. FM]VFK22009.1 MAG: hypothetical protein BECKFM1743B_GA0114221_108332 [Candidatus Kentron sp. FM]
MVGKLPFAALVLFMSVTVLAAEPSSVDTAGRATSGMVSADSDVERFRGYVGVPDFEAVSRKKQLRLYPCVNCHRFLPVNATPRKLITASPHPSTLQHGKGRLWCPECHHMQNKDFLHTVADGEIDFDQEHLVCGQCHYSHHKDWYFGVHGKRLGNWRGKRKMVLCSHCHNPHKPVIEPRKPREMPSVRIGLEPMRRPAATRR